LVLVLGGVRDNEDGDASEQEEPREAPHGARDGTQCAVEARTATEEPPAESASFFTPLVVLPFALVGAACGPR